MDIKQEMQSVGAKIVDVFFEDAELVQNDDIVKIRTEGEKNTKVIVIDVNDGMSVVTVFPDEKVIGVKYLENKDDFEYIGHPSDLYF